LSNGRELGRVRAGESICLPQRNIEERNLEERVAMTSRDEARKAFLEHVDEERIITLFRTAIQIPSITTDEKQIAELVYGELQDIGLDRVEMFDFKPNRPNVWSVLQGTGGGRNLMFAGHYDTVPVHGWEEHWKGTERESPFSAALVDGEIWGRGSGDMKAGVVGVIEALRAIKESGIGLRGNVVGVFVGDEESGIPGTGFSDGIKAIASKIEAGDIPSADFAIYTEPTTLDIYSAQIGFILADITIHGKSAYYGKPWLGVDAVRGAHKVLSALFEYSDQIWESDRHPLLGRRFNLVTAIQGGGYIAVPETCKISLIRKILPSESVPDVQAELENIMQRLAIRDGIQTEMVYTAPRDEKYGGQPAEISVDLEAVRCLTDAIREVTGKVDVVQGSPYWSETSILVNRLGIPAVYCGAGDITNCHTLNERVKVKELVDSVRAFGLMMLDFCGLA
jgi:acetylornithine deacetylase